MLYYFCQSTYHNYNTAFRVGYNAEYEEQINNNGIKILYPPLADGSQKLGETEDYSLKIIPNKNRALQELRQTTGVHMNIISAFLESYDKFNVNLAFSLFCEEENK